MKELVNRSFEMTCQRAYAIVLILIVVPIACVSGMIALMLKIDNMPDWLVYVLSFAAVGISVLLTLRAITRYANVPCVVTLNEEGIRISIRKGSVFFPVKEYYSSWARLKSVSENTDARNGRIFYIIGFREPQVNLYLNFASTPEGSENEILFGEILDVMVAKVNSSADLNQKSIDTRNFYQQDWARYLTFFVWLFTITIFILAMAAPDIVEWWRVLQFSAFSSVWLASYYYNRRKNRQKP